MNEKDFKVEKMDFNDLERFLNNYHKKVNTNRKF